ncbi:MAG: winged helix-turn-helix domain-containing protein [Dyella sp.]|nr:winged helix-turn-helix domain-containing protein [Dyella sp.]
MANVPTPNAHPARVTWRIGEWIIDPGTDQISRDGSTVRVEARAMQLLLSLARRPGEVVSIDDLLGEAWPDVIVTPDSVYQAVTSLRRLLGDDPRQPTYIATVPRQGYRLIARVEVLDDDRAPGVPVPATQHEPFTPQPVEAPRPSAPVASRLLLLAAALVVCVTGLYLFTRERAATVAPAAAAPVASDKSIAVLAFLDLTDTMNEEPFADGMTEELINRLSKAPGMKVAAPRSSFYYKDKQVPLADIARSLGVAYILDGSVRSSGKTMRVAARLVRAQDGFVIWSSTYDRPLDDKLKVQDEIASEVASALGSAIK